MVDDHLILSSCCLKNILQIDLHLLGLTGEHRTKLYQSSQVESLFEKILINFFHKD